MVCTVVEVAEEMTVDVTTDVKVVVLLAVTVVAAGVMVVETTMVLLDVTVEAAGVGAVTVETSVAEAVDV